jgi:crotonobetainyl-CoA:carnitine CoA-transferase CaiB-like acyl-CoA transferase
MFFAELGAQVIKIENKTTKGDVTRRWKLPQEDKTQNIGAYFHSINWNKETRFKDLRAPADKEEVFNLIKKADIVIANFKSGSAQKMGMAYEQLKIRNPKLIYAEVNAYGEDNPKPGFDVVIQAETGWVYMNGEPNGNPMKLPVALMDVLAAHQLKEGILLALLNRYKTGKGCKVSISLFDAGVASLVNQASNWLNVGVIPQRMGSQHANIAPYGDIFQTADEQLVIVAPGVEKQYHNLLECLGLEELKTEEQFANNALRLKNRATLNEHLSRAFQQFLAADILDLCHEKQVPIAPIRNMKQVFELPAAKDLILEEKKEGKVSKRVKTAVFKITA